MGCQEKYQKIDGNSLDLKKKRKDLRRLKFPTSAQLEKERTKRSIQEQSRRASSAAYLSNRSQKSPEFVTSPASPYSQKSSVASPGKTSLSPSFLSPSQMADRPSDRVSFRSGASSPKPSIRLDVETKTTSGRTTRTTCTKTFTFDTPSNYSIPVRGYNIHQSDQNVKPRNVC